MECLKHNVKKLANKRKKNLEQEQLISFQILGIQLIYLSTSPEPVVTYFFM